MEKTTQPFDHKSREELAVDLCFLSPGDELTLDILRVIVRSEISGTSARFALSMVQAILCSGLELPSDLVRKAEQGIPFKRRIDLDTGRPWP